MSASDESPPYQVVTKPAVDRSFGRKPRELQRRLAEAMRGLAANPRPPGAAPVLSRPGALRIRVGDWRLIYSINDEQRLVTILEIMPRGEDYRLR